MVRSAYFLGVLAILQIVSWSDAQALEKKVRVDSPYKYKKAKNGRLELTSIPYRERRSKWGFRINLAASSGFETSESKFNIKAGEILPLESKGVSFQIDISFTRNFKYFSIGPEIGYFNSTIVDECEKEIDFAGPSFGASLYLDGLYKSAYVVPFASVGALMPGLEIEGRTKGTCTATGKELESATAALYYRLGFLIGLNWLDKALAVEAFNGYGLENTFMYFALRQIPSTSSDENADFGTEPYLEYGLQLEF